MGTLSKNFMYRTTTKKNDYVSVIEFKSIPSERSEVRMEKYWNFNLKKNQQEMKM